MWFPIDQPEYQRERHDEVAAVKQFLEAAAWKETDPLPPFRDAYDEVFDTLPPNFDDDLFTKPAVQRKWLHQQQHTLYGFLDRSDTRAWLRHLDYYWRLHQEGDRNLGRVLDALDASGADDRTAVIFTADHGDMCGSHGLRSKGPFIYDEIMPRPAVRAGARAHPPGTRTTRWPAISTSPAPSAPWPEPRRPTCRATTCHRSSPSRAGPQATPSSSPRTWPGTTRAPHCGTAIRGMFDGRYKVRRATTAAVAAGATRPAAAPPETGGCRRALRGPGPRALRPPGGPARAAQPGHGPVVAPRAAGLVPASA